MGCGVLIRGLYNYIHISNFISNIVTTIMFNRLTFRTNVCCCSRVICYLWSHDSLFSAETPPVPVMGNPSFIAPPMHTFIMCIKRLYLYRKKLCFGRVFLINFDSTKCTCNSIQTYSTPSEWVYKVDEKQ